MTEMDVMEAAYALCELGCKIPPNAPKPVKVRRYAIVDRRCVKRLFFPKTETACNFHRKRHQRCSEDCMYKILDQ